MKLGAQHKIRRTTVLSIASGAMLIGIALPYYGTTIAHPIRWAIGCFLMAIVLCRFVWAGLLVFAIAGCFFIGMARGSVVASQLQQYVPIFHQEVVLHGRVVDDVAINEARHQQEFHLSTVQFQNNNLPGRVQIRTFDETPLRRGDLVQVSGTLRPSIGTARQGTINSAKVEVTHKTDSVVEGFRTRFFAAINTIMPEPQASLGLGYVVGLRVSLPEEVNEQLQVTGLTHIIAVSGYNLTILVQAARRLFAKHSAYQSVIFAGLLLVGFVVIAGGSASINRAAVVCVLSLLAWYYGRAFKPVLLLLLSGVITGLYNPLYVWGDPGWYLSFLAFTGILVLAPLVTRRCFQDREPRLPVQILLETLCAQLFTIPYSMYLFGGVSLIAPFANLVVLPFIPFIMLGVVIAGLSGIVAPLFASVIALLPSALLSLQLWIIKSLSNFSWAHQEVTISVAVMFAMFGVLVFSVIVMQRRFRLEKRDEIHYTNRSDLV